MSLFHKAAPSVTFVLLQGCDTEDYEDLDLWLRLMKDSAGHPLLTVALFFELHYRRLRRIYGDYNAKYIQHDDLTAEDDPLANGHGESRVALIMELHEDLLELEAELVALRASLSKFMKSMDFVHSFAPTATILYITTHGGRMTDRLLSLGSEIDVQLVKTTNVRQSVATLMAAMWNVTTLRESKLSQQISIASKRDSTVMIAIAVGTSLFLPLTAMASIFAMPFLPWNVQPGNRVKGHPLLIYLTLSLPLTAVTVVFLLTWIAVVDYEAKTAHLTLKAGPKKFVDRLLRRKKPAAAGGP
jgi:hypothetical protein